MISRIKRRILWTGLWASSVALSGLAFAHFAPRTGAVAVRRVAVRAPAWTWTGPALKIAVLSELTAGDPHADLAKIREAARRINGERPDLIVVMGDLIVSGARGDDSVEPEAVVSILKSLKAPLGVWAVLGDRDGWYDGPRISSSLAGAGISVLDNRAVTLEYRGKRFTLAALEDLAAGERRVSPSLESVSEEQPVIFLTHSPGVFPGLPRQVHMTLVGRVRGGQAEPRGYGEPRVASRPASRGFSRMIVDDDGRGFGDPGPAYESLPVRFRVPPEVAILALRRSR